MIVTNRGLLLVFSEQMLSTLKFIGQPLPLHPPNTLPAQNVNRAKVEKVWHRASKIFSIRNRGV